MKQDALILVRGGGDLATGTIHRLWSAGLRVLVLEAEHPAAIRRQVSLCEAVYEGEATVEGLRAVRIEALAQAEEVWNQNAVPVLVDPKGESIAQARPDVLVDAILAKKNLGTAGTWHPLPLRLVRASLPGRTWMQWWKQNEAIGWDVSSGRVQPLPTPASRGSSEAMAKSA